MEDTNLHLKMLLSKTDMTFKALMREPGSEALNNAYEKAKEELDDYMVSLRHSLEKRKVR